MVIRYEGWWPRGSSYHWTTEDWILCSTKHREMDWLGCSRQGWWLDGMLLLGFNVCYFKHSLDTVTSLHFDS